MTTSNVTGLPPALAAYEAPFLQNKMIAEGYFTTPQQFEQGFTELKKFLYLVHSSNKDMPLTAVGVDAIWHQFILFTAQYTQFCQQFFGTYIHHEPQPSPDPAPASTSVTFAALYAKQFGQMPALWSMRGSRADGTVCNGAPPPPDGGSSGSGTTNPSPPPPTPPDPPDGGGFRTLEGSLGHVQQNRVAPNFSTKVRTSGSASRERQG